MATRYLVFRTSASVDDHADLSRPAAWRRTRAGDPPLSMDVTVEHGHERDLGSLRADPRNVAVLDADIKMMLVRPKAVAAVAVGDATPSLKLAGSLQMPQGLIAVGAHATQFTG